MINNVKLIKKGIVIKTIGKFGVTNLRKSGSLVYPSKIIFYILLISALFLLSRCARPVSPQGGPKDVTPPTVISCDPLNFGTHFHGKSFRIDFDEFISLKNPVKEIFISPPIGSLPETRLRGKSLIVRFNDSLAPNTTYSITFGNAIEDLAENNVLRGFNYVFSTGDFVDSLSLHGNLQTAFDHKAQKDVFIELYMNNNDTLPFDSLPLRVPPYYITKTDEQGNFIFHNLRNEQFKLFALADQNGDLIFNQPSEKIAFYDSLVKPYYIEKPEPDTLQKDSTVIDSNLTSLVTVANTDSLHKPDSVLLADSIKQNLPGYPSCSLYLFEESDSIQRLKKSAFPMEGMVLLVFRFPVNALRIVPLNFDTLSPWYIPEMSKQRDSVYLWITRPNVDSLIAEVIVDQKVMDTIHLEVSKKESQKKSAKTGKQGQLGLSVSATGSGLNQFKHPLFMTFTFPLIRWDFGKVLLITEKDTIHPELSFSDSLKRKILLIHKWEEGKNYKIVIPDSVFFGINNFSHDSILIPFKTREEKDFGNLIVTVNLDKRPGRYIVQLMNDNESIVYEEHMITGSEEISFDFMPPGKYKLKAINDRNGNGRWDTGNYKLKIQPEEVIYFPKTIEIRGNWDVEETWD